MPLPVSVTTIPVHIKILSLVGGTPATGRVVFSGDYALLDTTGKVVVGPPYAVATLDVNGEATINLVATNIPNLTPVNWAYRVTVDTNIWRELLQIQIPYNTVGTLELSDIAPVTTPPVVSPVPVPTSILAFSNAGIVQVSTGTARIYNDSGRFLTIRSVRATVGTAPTGASLITDVKKNGVTIFTTQPNRPTIAAGTNTSGKVTTMNVTAFNDGDYITADVAQIGSSAPGSDLTLQIWLS